MNIIDTPLHFETDYIQVKYIADGHYVDEIWKSYADEEEVTLAQNKVMEVMKNSGTSAYIADMTHFKGTTPNVMLYVKNEWFTKMYYEIGLRTLSMVVPPDIFGQFSLETVINEGIADKVTKGKFQSYAEAREWILKYSEKH